MTNDKRQRAAGVTSYFVVCSLLLVVLLAASCAHRKRIGTEEQKPSSLPVYLNHVYLCVNDATFESISGSDMLDNQLANTMTVQTGATGLPTVYIIGEQTYIEIVRASQKEGYPAGDCGVIFGVEERDDIERVAKRLHADVTETRYDDGTIRFREVKAANEGERRGFESSVIEYDLQGMYSRYRAEYPDSLIPEQMDISRRLYNNIRYHFDLLLKDIEGITLALEPDQREAFATELELFGYEIVNTGEEIIAEGPDIVFTLVPADADARGIEELKLSLQRSKTGKQSVKLGQSEIEFRDTTAVWRF